MLCIKRMQKWDAHCTKVNNKLNRTTITLLDGFMNVKSIM